ncbi:MAG TPA: hypothetical protein VFV71_03805 [Burkholderiales bacterium]|nr:hypothetical protein [Burkholderiales bacterium]
MTREVVRAQACTGFAVSPDGSRFRLHFDLAGERDCALDLPVSELAPLMRLMPQIQQIALPQRRGDASLRVMRTPVSWSLERDMTDESLALVLVTDDGFEWCFQLGDAEIFRMAEFLRDERMTTLPAPGSRQ